MHIEGQFRPKNKDSKMTFAAEIVIRKNNNIYEAGFASKTTGTKVESFGRWYGSQMNYRPFRAAMDAANRRATELNAALVQEVAHV